MGRLTACREHIPVPWNCWEFLIAKAGPVSYITMSSTHKIQWSAAIFPPPFFFSRGSDWFLENTLELLTPWDFTWVRHLACSVTCYTIRTWMLLHFGFQLTFFCVMLLTDLELKVQKLRSSFYPHRANSHFTSTLVQQVSTHNPPGQRFEYLSSSKRHWMGQFYRNQCNFTTLSNATILKEGT